MLKDQNSEQWKYCIESGNGKPELGLVSLWQYRGLIYLFARRDFTSKYRQTVLGPLWMFITPILSTLVFTVIFGNMAKFPTTDSEMPGNLAIPAFLFFMIGNILWKLFSNISANAAKSFLVNAKIMGKVYYPRLVSPVASAFSELATTAVRLLLFVCFMVWGSICGIVSVRLSRIVLLFPLSILQLMLLGLGIGLIISSLTVKYRDIGFMVDFVLQLWLYLTPVAYGLQLVPERWLGLYMLNPVTPIITTARYLCFGGGYFQIWYVIWSWAATVLFFIIGCVLFNHTEKTFIDVI